MWYVADPTKNSSEAAIDYGVFTFAVAAGFCPPSDNYSPKEYVPS